MTYDLFTKVQVHLCESYVSVEDLPNQVTFNHFNLLASLS
jgi:hypothetical protein